MEAVNFDIDQGSTFKADVQITNPQNEPVDLTGCSLRGQVRKTTSSSAVLANFTFSDLDLPAGSFTIGLTAAETAAFPCDPSSQPIRTISQFAYDVEATYADGTVERLLGGVLNFSPEVTR